MHVLHAVLQRTNTVLRENPWVKDDPKKHFVDFENRTKSISTLENSLEVMKEDRAKLDSRLNKKVFQKID